VAAQLAELLAALEHGPCVRVLVLDVKGSAPRDPGAGMLVTPEYLSGSIGGGRLEFAAENTAREMLSGTDARAQFTEVHGLGPDHEQCCGGAVTLLFQRFDPADRQALRDAVANAPALRWDYGSSHPTWQAGELAAKGGFREETRSLVPELCLFGAGHVGTALVPLLAGLSIPLRWYDPRTDRLPKSPPPHVIETRSDDPLGMVDAAGDDALFLVMTHSHPLDEDLCHAVLSRGRFGWLGLIGSKSKRARFVHRLARRGIEPALLERLQCPVGLPDVRGKRPATIALSIAAQLVAERLPEALR